MIAPKSPVKLTYADYAETPEDERWELLNGELLMAPAPNTEHQSVQAETGWRLQTFVKAGYLGRIFYAPTDVVLSEHDVVQPDLLFVAKERAHIIGHANIQGPPDLVVEIVSPSTAIRDWRDKLDLYARHGVKEYWLLSPAAGTAWVFGLDDGNFRAVGTYGRDETLSSPTLQGFTLDLADVFT